MARTAGALLVLAALLGLCLWADAKAPCSWYSHTTMRNVPARCLTIYRR
jgi:hypothetical protein